jgi:hypothetical protein
VSNPIDTTKVGPLAAIQNALCELVSAESSLNMYPDPICDRPTDGQYLSQTDANVAHAMEHMHAAFRLMNMAYQDQETLKTQIYRLVTQLREAGLAPCVSTWLDICPRCDVPTKPDALFSAARGGYCFCDACTKQLEEKAT